MSRKKRKNLIPIGEELNKIKEEAERLENFYHNIDVLINSLKEEHNEMLQTLKEMNVNINSIIIRREEETLDSSFEGNLLNLIGAAGNLYAYKFFESNMPCEDLKKEIYLNEKLRPDLGYLDTRIQKKAYVEVKTTSELKQHAIEKQVYRMVQYRNEGNDVIFKVAVCSDTYIASDVLDFLNCNGIQVVRIKTKYSEIKEYVNKFIKDLYRIKNDLMK